MFHTITRPLLVKEQHTVPSSIPFPSLQAKNHNSPTLPHAVQSPPTTCKKNCLFIIHKFASYNLAASIVTASLKQVTSLVCSSELSPLSSGQALSRSGRSRAASPRSLENWFRNISWTHRTETWAKCKVSMAA